MINVITIHGRLTRNPELNTYGNEGKKRCNFTVAVNKTSGEGANFFDCVCFGKRGEALEKYFSRGDAIVVSGSMESNNYEDKNGNKRTSWSIFVNEWDFAEKKSNGARQSEPNVDEAFQDASGDDVPF